MFVRKKAMKDLADSERQFGSVIRTAIDAIISADINGTIFQWNLAAEKMFGYSADEITGKPLTTIMPERYHKSHLKGLERVAKTGKTRLSGRSVELAGLRKDGSEFPLELTIAQWEKEDGIFFTAIIRDITKRKEAEDALHESEKQFRDLYESAPNAYFSVGVDGCVRRCNRRAGELLGYAVEELVGKSVLELYADTPNGKQKAAKVLERFRAGETIRDEELEMQKADSTFVWISLSVNPVRDAEGRIIESRSVVADIIERKHAEQEIQNLAKFPSENPNPVLRVTKDGVLLYANSASASFLTEWGRQEGQPVGEQWRRMVSEVFASGSEKRFEIEHMRRTLSFVFVPVAEGGYVNIYGRDITERKRAEREREHLMTSLKEKNEAFEQFFHIVRHDLGNPLLSIQAFGIELGRTTEQLLQLLEGQDIEQKVKERLLSLLKDEIPSSLGFIRSAADEMSRLLEGLKQVVTAGRAVISIEPLDVNQLITQITETMRFQIEDCGASITVEELAGCLGDSTQVKQVFTNLLTNAVKYLEPGRKGQIKIWGRVERDNSIYCVEDNGIGISPEQQTKVFDVFYRVDPSNPASGEGLGLSIADRILEHQNGKIWVESQKGKGSKFFISLPSD